MKLRILWLPSFFLWNTKTLSLQILLLEITQLLLPIAQLPPIADASTYGSFTSCEYFSSFYLYLFMSSLPLCCLSLFLFFFFLHWILSNIPLLLHSISLEKLELPSSRKKIVRCLKKCNFFIFSSLSVNVFECLCIIFKNLVVSPYLEVVVVIIMSS